MEEESAQRRRRAVREEAARGRAIAKQSPLHRILALRDGPAVVRGSEIVAARVAELFSRKWAPQGDEWQDIRVASAAAQSTEPPAWTAQQISRAAAKLRAPQRVEHEGIAPHALLGAAEVVPEAVCSAFAQFAGSAESMRAQVIVAHAFGKKSSCPSVDRVRAIMPLSSVMGVIDILVSDAIHSTLDPAVCEGARPASGATELAWMARMVVEKSLGRGSHGALGQGGIKQFYDHIPVSECCGRLLDMGSPASVAHTAYRHQMLPQMVMRTGLSCADVGVRKLGAVKGSRTAGALVRVVVRDMLS